MPASHQTAEGARPRRRADAERSIARILDAAVDALGDDQEASMAEIARRAGVVRATIYVHFPTRETLLDAVTERALAETAAAIAEAEPERGDPADALARVVAAAWRKLGRYHALVAINTSTQAPERAPPPPRSSARQAAPARRTRTSRGRLPRGRARRMAPVDAPGAHSRRRARSCAPGECRADEAEAALVATVLGAVASPGPQRTDVA